MTEKQRAKWNADRTIANLGNPDWLRDEYLQQLMIAFEDAGFRIYAVGGCVRDTVLDRHVMDVDLATDALPEQTIKIVEALTHSGKNWKAVPTGIEHGTITAVSPLRPFEITTFRTDVETDGRHATVAFSDNMEDDAMRRDFTINAFYADRHGQVYDFVGGSADLAARRVRFIGDPLARIEEDYLRILRFFRFTATHANRDDGIDADGLSACAILADGLDDVSRERIGAEFTRIIGDWDPAPIIGSMELSGVLNRILPGASVATLARLVDLEKSYPIEGRGVTPADIPTRLASLGCEDISDRLRLSKTQSAKVELTRTQAGLMTPMHELGYRFDFWPAVHCALLRWATLLQPFDTSAIDQIERGAAAEFPVTAADLMPKYQGKALGDRIKTLESAWIAADFALTKAQLLARR